MTQHLQDPNGQSVQSKAHEAALARVLCATTLLIVAEIVGAQLSGSLVLLSDAVHVASDALSIVVTLVALRWSRRPADTRRTYGYLRLEAVGALLNAAVLMIACGWILFEAIVRLRHPHLIVSNSVLVIAVLGLLINSYNIKVLAADRGEDLLIKGAYLEYWSDIVSTACMIVAAIVMKWTRCWWIDPLSAIAIGAWVMPRMVILLSEALNVILEGAPPGMNVAEVAQSICTHPGVQSVHDLHIWALATNTPALTVHVVVVELGQLEEYEALRTSLCYLLHSRYRIDHVTIQLERSSHVGDRLCAYSYTAEHAHPQAELPVLKGDQHSP